jgi:ABC-2 type transport system permease protein
VAELSLRRGYRVLVGSRIRSQLAYRTSFTLLTLTSAAVGVVELTELYVILHNVPVFGGLNFAQAGVVFALANMGFSLADLVFGQLDSIPTLLRAGQLEALLVRPMPLMAQLITTDFQLRRAGRAIVSVAVLVVALIFVPTLEWSPAVIYLLVATPIFGALIYGGLFAIAGGVQFFLIDGAEFTASFVYGSSYAGELPGSVLSLPIRVAFTFVAPATITAYAPALLIMDLPGPALLPSWLGWLAPIFAGTTWVLGWLTWRTGVRHFTGAGG